MKRNYIFFVTLLIIGVAALLWIGTQFRDLRRAQSELSQTLEKELQEKMDEQEEHFKALRSDIEKNKVMALESRKLILGFENADDAKTIKEWRPFVASLHCIWAADSEDKEDVYGSGTGKIMSAPDGTVQIMTNRHVVYQEEKKPSECLITLPTSQFIYEVSNPEVFSGDATDVAYMQIEEVNSALRQLAVAADERGTCPSKAETGTRVIALGYPGIGAVADVTATEGIISGYEENRYISSVKIDRGNSGGLAIDVKRNCYLGITTSAVVGEVESLARILDYRSITEAQ